MWQLRYMAETLEEEKLLRRERSVIVGSLADFPRERDCWREVDRRRLHNVINTPDAETKIRFSQLADLYLNSQAFKELQHTTQYCWRHNINDYLIPRWGREFAVELKSLAVEEWLEALTGKAGKPLAGPTKGKIKYNLIVVLLYAEKRGFLPDGWVTNFERKISIRTSSDYEAVILTPQQTSGVLSRMRQPERTMTLLVAATGLRFSELAGLQWQDVDYEKSQIHVRRSWIDGVVSERLKTKKSRSAVPMAPMLSEFLREWQQETAYGKPSDWVFASLRTHGRTPRVGNMLVSDYLRPAALKAGVNLQPGQRFGFHNLRHSLSSLLVTGMKTDVGTAKDMLRHSNASTTLEIYTQSPRAQRIAAQEQVLNAILFPPTNGLVV
jgi:integrase